MLKEGQEVWIKAIVAKPKPDYQGDIYINLGGDLDFWVNQEEIMTAMPEKPVIPQFVADWIELCKGTGYSLRDGLEHIALPSEVNLWLLEEGDLLTYPNQETFASAWLFGYEIEQEQLYTVEIPDPRGLYEHRYLFKHSNGVTIGANDSDIWKTRSECQLTEAEIKEDFEWAWQWAKPVEE